MCRARNVVTLLITAACLIGSSLFSLAETKPEDVITFNGKTFGGADYDEGLCVHQTSDGGYIILGTTRSFGAGDLDIYLIKTDKYGEKKWGETFGGADYEKGGGVEETSDGGYIIIGTTRSFGAGKSDMYLIKTNALGKESWHKTFGREGNEYGNAVLETSDGGFLLLGSNLIKTDKDGNEEWKKVYSDSVIYEGFSMQQTNDGNYILLGATKTSRFGKKKLNLVKVDEKGNILDGWPKPLLKMSGDQYSVVKESSNGGFIVTGGSESLKHEARDMVFMKTNSSGKKLWYHSLGGTMYDRGNSVEQTHDKGYISLGVTQSKGAGKSDFYVVKTSAVGKVIWEKTFGGTEDDVGNSIHVTSDGGLVMLGSTGSKGAGKSDIYLIKTDAKGNIE